MVNVTEKMECPWCHGTGLIDSDIMNTSSDEVFKEHKRFALVYNQMPGRMVLSNWLRDNFDYFKFTPGNVQKIIDREYEAVWIYVISDANKELFHAKTCEWNEIPIYLRTRGYSGKIIHQTDNDGLTWTEYSQRHLLGYIDGVAIGGLREYGDLGVPVFYVQFPLIFPRHVKDPKELWRSREQKNDRIVSLKHAMSMPYGAEKVAENVDRELNIIGYGVPPKHGEDYWNYISYHTIGVEASIKYYGWSRFWYECTVTGTPCVAKWGTGSATMCNPELVGDSPMDRMEDGHDPKLNYIARRLLDDEDYWYKMRDLSYKSLIHHNSQEEVTKRYINGLKAVGIKF